MPWKGSGRVDPLGEGGQRGRERADRASGGQCRRGGGAQGVDGVEDALAVAAAAVHEELLAPGPAFGLDGEVAGDGGDDLVDGLVDGPADRAEAVLGEVELTCTSG
jgi:hypothetical protein